MSQSIDELANKLEKNSKLNAIHQSSRNKNSSSTSSSSNANNNDETFISEYLHNNDDLLNTGSGAEDGRASGGSNSSSAFYDDDSNNLLSSSTNSVTNDGQRSPSASSSGRSSANDSSLDTNDTLTSSKQQIITPASDSKVLNPISNLAERNDKYYNVIARIRSNFLKSLEDLSEEELKNFEQIDLEELRKPLTPIERQEESLTFRLISRFVTNNKLFEKKGVANCKDDQIIEQCIKQGVESLTNLLKFRTSYQLTNVIEEQFCKEFYNLSGAFVFGHDKQNLPVFYLRARIHKRWSKNLDEAFRRYLAWQLNMITKSHHGDYEIKKSIGTGIEKDGSFGICFDCGDIGYPNLDMDFLKFIVNLLVNYYPTYCRYALCVDLPWLFRSVWKLVRTWLPEDARETVQLITSKQLTDFIDEKQIPNSMRFNDMKASEKPILNKHKIPKNWSEIKEIDEFAEEFEMSTSELKQFKIHVGKVKKEYENIGAI